MESTIDILNKTKSKIPKLPFSEMKEAVLGKTYELSVVFVGVKKIRTLNKTHRGKDSVTDILSFPLTRTSGEIFICLEKTKTKAVEFNKSSTEYLGFLFIHGLLHLKGMEHGSTMEKAEKKMCKKFGF